jgi:AAA domain
MPLVRAADLDTSPPDYVVKDMLPDMGVGFGYGGSYTGKSFTLGIELCLAIGNGLPYFGHETVQGETVWCLGEGQTDAGVRIKARLVREQHDRKMQAAEIARRQGHAIADAWLASLPPYNDDRMSLRMDPFQVPLISDNEPPEELRQAARELSLIEDLRLVVLDTARRFSVLSLSNGTTSNRFMLGMTWLSKQLKCPVLAIAHPVSKGRGEVGLPGDTLFGASDFVWRVQRGEDSTDDAPNAMIIAEKVKTGPLFDPIAYEIERIKWKQPPTDRETGEDILGVPLITVGSATARQLQNEQQASAASILRPSRVRKPLPEAEPVPSGKPVRRTGIKPRAAFRSVLAPAEPVSADEAERAAMVATLISGTCEDCLVPPGAGCNPAIPGSGIVILDKNPLICAHTARMDERVTAGLVPLDDVLAQFPAGTAPELLTASQP